jgi:hypothetical protein
MHLKTIVLVPALIARVGAIETHGGYTFESRFSSNATPETSNIKNPYETTAAEQVATHLREQIQATGIASHCLEELKGTGTSPADLYALKDCIVADNEDNFFILLAKDIEESNAFWDQVLSESTSDRTQWVPARAVSNCLYSSCNVLGHRRFSIFRVSQTRPAAHVLIVLL